MGNPKDPDRAIIDYAKILSYKLRQVPAWRDFAKSCNEVLGKEVDDLRRKLEKVRDSVKYRRGDTILNTVYKPDTSKKAVYRDTREIADIPENYVIPSAKVRNVVKNIAYYGSPGTTDYLEIEFVYEDRATAWLKPIEIPQERDILLKNSYIAGFDFFNTKFSDEDLQRLYEFIQIYWPESGTNDNYMKFIGFIKNARFDLVNLWSYDDGTDTFPELEPRTAKTVPAYEGGKHYLTSHVEIRLDLAQFGQYYTVDLNDLETLFYYFAPIIVVLERVVLYLEYPDAVINVGTTTQMTLASFASDYPEDSFEATIRLAKTAQNSFHFYAMDVADNPTYYKGSLIYDNEASLVVDENNSPLQR